MPRQNQDRSGSGSQRQGSRDGRTDIHIHTNGERGGTRPQQGQRVTRSDTDAFVNRLISRHGSAETALTHLAGEQLKYRQRTHEAEARAEDAESKLPPQGAVVLTGEEAAEVTKLRTEVKDFSFKGLGDVLKEHKEYKGTAEKNKRQQAIATVAGDKYKPRVLERILGDAEFTFKTRIVPDPDSDDEDATKEIQIPFVKSPDGTTEQFDTWFEREHPEFYEMALVADSGDGDDGERQERQSSKKGSESRVPPQRRSTSQDSSKGKKKSEEGQLNSIVGQVTGQYQSPAQRKAAAEKK